MNVEQLKEAMADHPIAAVIYGPESLPVFLQADARVCFLANLELRRVPAVVRAIREHRRHVIVNVDAISGLAQDRAGVEFLKDVGVTAVVTTRGSLVPRIRSLGLMAMQKVFITDRSNLPRTIESVQNAQPDAVQLMPAPILAHIDPDVRRLFEPFITGGFVVDAAAVRSARRHGAIGVTTQTTALWFKQGRRTGVTP